MPIGAYDPWIRNHCTPEQSVAMFHEMAGDGRSTVRNPVWDGQAVQLFGAQGKQCLPRSRRHQTNV